MTSPRSYSFENLPIILPLLTNRDVIGARIIGKTNETKSNNNISQILTDRYPVIIQNKSTYSSAANLLNSREVLSKRNFYHHTSIYKLDEYRDLSKQHQPEQNTQQEDESQFQRPILEQSQRKLLIADFKRKVAEYMLTIKYKKDNASKSFRKFYSNLKIKTQEQTGNSVIHVSKPNLSQLSLAGQSQVHDQLSKNRFNYNAVCIQFHLDLLVGDDHTQQVINRVGNLTMISHKALQSKILQKLDPFLNNDRIDYDEKMHIIMLQYEEIVDRIYSEAFHIIIPDNFKINPSDYNEFYSVEPKPPRYKNNFERNKLVEHIIDQVKLPIIDEFVNPSPITVVVEDQPELAQMKEEEPIQVEVQEEAVQDDLVDVSEQESEVDERGKKTGNRVRKPKITQTKIVVIEEPIVEQPLPESEDEQEKLQNQKRQKYQQEKAKELEKEREKEKEKEKEIHQKERRQQIEKLEENMKKKKANQIEYQRRKEQELTIKSKKKTSKDTVTIESIDDNAQHTPQKRERRKPKDQIQNAAYLQETVPPIQLQGHQVREYFQGQTSQEEIIVKEASPTKSPKKRDTSRGISQVQSQMLIQMPPPADTFTQALNQIASKKKPERTYTPPREVEKPQESLEDMVSLPDHDSIIYAPDDPTDQQSDLHGSQQRILSPYNSQQLISPKSSPKQAGKAGNRFGTPKKGDSTRKGESPTKKGDQSSIKLNASPKKKTRMITEEEQRLEDEQNKLRDEINNQIYKMNEVKSLSYLELLLSSDCVFDINIDTFKLAHQDPSCVVIPNIDKEDQKVIYREMYSWRQEVLQVIPKLHLVNRDALPDESSDEQQEEEDVPPKSKGKYKQKQNQSDSD